MTLHLDSLYISGFRGIPKLEIPRLGRVTLLAGKNGVGKTTVLDAVRMYAGRSRYGVIAAILRSHGELRRVTDLDGAERQDPNWPALFYGRDQWLESGIRIGPYDACRQMAAHADWIDIARTKPRSFSQLPRHEILALDVAYGDRRWVVPIGHPLPDFPGRRFQSSEYEPPQEIGCESLGPGLPDPLTLARFWDDVVIRNEQSLAVDALNLILDAPAEGDCSGWRCVTAWIRPGASGYCTNCWREDYGSFAKFGGWGCPAFWRCCGPCEQPRRFSAD